MYPQLKQGSTAFDPRTGLPIGSVQFDPNTGQRLNTGATIAAPAFNMNAPVNVAGLAQAPLTIANTMQPPALTGSMVANQPIVEKSIQDYYKSLEAPANVDPIFQKSSSLTDRISSLIGMNTGRTSALQEAENAQGIPQIQKDIADISGQIGIRTAEYNQAIKNREGQGGVRLVVDAEKNRLAAQAEGEIGVLQATVLAKTGQLSTARDLATRAVDLKYEPIEEELNAKIKQLQLLEPELNRAEQRLSTARQRQYEDEKAAINSKKENEKAINNLIVEASQQGVSSVKINAAMKATNPAQAASILGISPTIALQQQQMRENLVTERLQQANIRSQINERGQKKVVTNLTPAEVKVLASEDPVAYISQVVKAAGINGDANLQNILGVISSTQALAQSHADKKFKGAATVRLTPGFLKGPKQLQTQGALEAINLKVQQWASGASLSKDQTAQVRKLTPDKNDTDNQIATKLNNLTNFMLQQTKGSLAAKGADYTPPTVDLFAPPKGLLDLADQYFK